MDEFSENCKFSLWDLNEVAGLFKTVENGLPLK